MVQSQSIATPAHHTDIAETKNINRLQRFLLLVQLLQIRSSEVYIRYFSLVEFNGGHEVVFWVAGHVPDIVESDVDYFFFRFGHVDGCLDRSLCRG